MNRIALEQKDLLFRIQEIAKKNSEKDAEEAKQALKRIRQMLEDEIVLY